MNAKSGIPSLNNLRATRTLLEAAADEICYYDASKEFPMVSEAYLQVRAVLPLIEQAIKKYERWQDDLIHKQQPQERAHMTQGIVMGPPQKLSDDEVDTLAAQVFTILMETFEQVVGKRGGSHV